MGYPVVVPQIPDAQFFSDGVVKNKTASLTEIRSPITMMQVGERSQSFP
jgi:hypothetical protein